MERKKGQRRSAQAGSTAERRRTVDSSRYSSPRGSSCHCDAYDVCGSRRPPRESKTLQRRQSPPRKVRENVLSYIAQDAHCPRLFKKSRAFSLWAEFFISEPAPFPPRKTGTFKTRRLLKNPRVPRCCQFCEDCKEPSAGLMGLRGPISPQAVALRRSLATPRGPKIGATRGARTLWGISRRRSSVTAPH